MPVWSEAFLWGLLSGSALLAGAAAGYFAHVPQRLVALVMAFGSGVLISALAFELMAEAYARGGMAWAAAGFLAGAATYTAGNIWLAARGGKHRKRSGEQQSSDRSEHPDSGTSIALGAVLDGIPESVALGVTLLHGGGVSMAMVAAIFLSNVPEGLSSATGMRKAGRSAGYVFGLWGTVALLSGLASLAGYAVFGTLPASVVAFAVALAAGAMLAMIADTMIPEAFEIAHDYIGLVTVCGFLAAFAISHAAN